MWNWLKSMFVPEKTEYQQLLDREADPKFDPPPKSVVQPDLTFKFVPYIKQPQPRPQPQPLR